MDVQRSRGYGILLEHLGKARLRLRERAIELLQLNGSPAFPKKTPFPCPSCVARGLSPPSAPSRGSGFRESEAFPAPAGTVRPPTVIEAWLCGNNPTAQRVDFLPPVGSVSDIQANPFPVAFKRKLGDPRERAEDAEEKKGARLTSFRSGGGMPAVRRESRERGDVLPAMRTFRTHALRSRRHQRGQEGSAFPLPAPPLRRPF